MEGDNYWSKFFQKVYILQLEEHMKACLRMFGSSSSSKPTTAIGLDSGTGETKVILFKVVDAAKQAVSVTELSKTSTLKGLFVGTGKEDEIAALTKTINDAVAEHKPAVVFAGVTAWYRDAPEEEKKACDAYFKSTFPKVEYLRLAANEEAKFEARAVVHASVKSGIGTPDMQIAAGGGSMNLIQGEEIFSIPYGFRKGQTELMAEGEEAKAAIIERLLKYSQTLFSGFIKENPKFKVAGDMKFIGISAAYYCAKGCKLEEGKSLKVSDILATFTTKKDKLIGEVEGNKPIDKKVAQEISNLIIFCEFYTHLAHPDAQVYFKRNWELDGIPFSTTWTAGRFLQLAC